MHGPIRYTFYQRESWEQEGPAKLRLALLPGKRRGPCGLGARKWMALSTMTTIATYHVRMVNGRATASGEKCSEALASWCATMSQLWPFPRTRGLGAVERNSFRFFPAGRFARSNGTNGTEKRTVLGELHRGLSYLMTGKGAWVAGADRGKPQGRSQSIWGVASGSASSHPDLAHSRCQTLFLVSTTAHKNQEQSLTPPTKSDAEAEGDSPNSRRELGSLGKTLRDAFIGEIGPSRGYSGL